MIARQETIRVSVKERSHRGRHTLIGLAIGTGVDATATCDIGCFP
jgi:hypothetical protein